MIHSVLIFVTSLLPINDEEIGTVVSVIDGNTIKVVKAPSDTCVVVLTGVDSPELTQDYGDKAQKFLEKLLLKEQVTIQFTGKDRKGNYLAVVTKGSIDPRIELLKEGLAWTAERDPLPELENHRTEAEQKKKGLWSNGNPIPPWIFRRQQSMMQPKSS